jgi:DNA-binding beta-propeller fold protein YncE
MLTSLMRTIGRRGIDAGDFQYPLGLCLARGHLLVADSGNNRVQVLRQNSDIFVRSLGESKLLSSPTDVAVSREGFIFVSDSGNHRIVAFDWEGRVTWLSNSTLNSGPVTDLMNPCGLVFDSAGD